MSVIEVRALTKVFPHRRGEENGAPALDELTLDVQPGEVAGLLGPNGAGKTTLIHILLGLTLPTRGEVKVFGRAMPAERQEILRRVNFSSAYVQMPFSLTPRENLNVFARMYGVSEPAKRVAEVLERMELGSMANKPTRALSSGQISRLNLAKALLNDPDLLLLDEPTASMDPDIAQKTREILRGIQRERKLTVLYTSHNMREMEQMATRILFLHRGKLVAEGTAAALLERFQENDLEKLFLRFARGGGA